jgi:hypothetical protein
MALITINTAAMINDQPNHRFAQINRLIMKGSRNCPAETKALINTFARLAEFGKDSISAG